MLTSSPSSSRLSRSGDHAARLSTRWYVVKCRSWPSPTARNAAVTVRRPAASSVPYTNTCAWAKVRVVNAGANVARIARIAGDGVGMVSPPLLSICHTPSVGDQAPLPPSRMAKVEG